MVRLVKTYVPLREIKFKAIGLSIVLTLLTSCVPVTLEVSTPEHPPLIESLPLTVGVYYSPEFLDCHYSSLDLFFRMDYYPGPASQKTFNYAFEAIFSEVLYLDDKPSYQNIPPEIDLIIEPKIENFSTNFDHPTLNSSAFTATVHFNLMFVSPKIEEVFSWDIYGSGADLVTFFELSAMAPLSYHYIKALEDAILDASAVFLASLRNQKELIRWLNDKGCLIESENH